MPVIIGSARHNEKGTLTGGKAGDNTGGEVSTQSFYVHKKGWVVLRHKNIAQSEQLAKAMQQACTNNHIGYCQTHRGGAINLLPKYGSLGAIPVNTETDCSDLVRACIMQATGIKLQDFTTETEKSVLLASGMFDAIEYTAGMTLYTGDILVTKTKGHTAIVTSGASRSAAKPVSKPTPAPSPATTPTYLTIKLGSKGEAVKKWQTILGVTADGSFGPRTEAATKTWQAAHGLIADGIVGIKTWQAINTAPVSTPKPSAPAFQKYNIKVLTALNVRSIPSTSGKVTTVIRDNGIYGIVAEQNGWGKLQSGAGWISLKYTKRI